MRIARGDVLRAAERQVWTDLGGEIAILDLTAGQYFGVAGVGARVWELLQEPRTLTELCSTIVAEYDVSAAACEADVSEFLESLIDRQLVRITAHASA
jgi:hypothetical protein